MLISHFGHSLAKKKSTIVFDTETMSYYSYVGDYWIGYDDV